MDKRYVCETYSSEVSDVKIWQELREGSVSALKTLFLRHHKHLYTYAVKLSSDRFLAEDCVHDLFFRIWDRREYLGEVRSIKSYLWISLRRDILKSMSNSREVLTDDIVTYLSDTQQELHDESVMHFQPEEFIIHNERKVECGIALTKALNQLSPRQREAIFLKFFNGMGYGEIEQIMSINYQTARNYVYDGIQSMKDYFEENPEKPVPYTFSLLLFLFMS